MGDRTLLRVSCVTSLLMASRSLARSECISATAWNWTCRGRGPVGKRWAGCM